MISSELFFAICMKIVLMHTFDHIKIMFKQFQNDCCDRNKNFDAKYIYIFSILCTLSVYFFNSVMEFQLIDITTQSFGMAVTVTFLFD